MSRVTSVVLLTQYLTEEEELAIAEDIGNGSRNFAQGLVELKGPNLVSGGSKIPEIDLAWGGINYSLGASDIIAKYEGKLRDALLIIWDQDDLRPTVVWFDTKKASRILCESELENFGY